MENEKIMFKSTYKTDTITICGLLQGEIWMPTVVSQKEFREVFSKNRSIPLSNEMHY